MNKQNILKKRIKTLRLEQKEAFDEMQQTPLLQLCYPCGFGKGYIIGTDILSQIVNTDARIFALCSHRLGLNDQHITDIFTILQPLIGEVVFAFVGSTGGLDMDKLVEYDNYKILRDIAKFNTKNNKRIAPEELTITTTKEELLLPFIRRHHDKKVVIVSTYHSLGRLSNNEIQINSLYCDEAHELASNFKESYSDNSFISSFQKIESPRKFFFSATPKDCSDDPFNSFLMNNTTIFGKRLEMSHKDAVDLGYVTDLVIRCLRPNGFTLTNNKDLGSIQNKARFIMYAFEKHREWLREMSSRPDMIAPKLLIRCSSVEKDMWPIYEALKTMAGDIKIFASASEDSNGGNAESNIIHQNNNKIEYNFETGEYVPWVKSISRKEYIESIQCLEDTEEAIVLHHDTISEGLNVPGFTCFIPFSDKLISMSKLYQNLGRIIRQNKIDKELFRKGELKVYSEGWIKSKADLIIPYWSNMSKAAAENMRKSIRNLCINTGAKIGTEIPFGDDMATGFNKNDEGSCRKRRDNRNENIDGVEIYTFWERENREIEVERENYKNRKLSALEGVKYLKENILNEKRN